MSSPKAEAESIDISSNNPPGLPVDLIAASILVVDVRNAQGITANSDQTNTNDSAFSSSPQNEQVQILTLAVKPEAVNAILIAVANTKKQGGLLWTTLAIP